MAAIGTIGNTTANPKPRRTILLFMAISQLVYTLLIVPWLFFAYVVWVGAMDADVYVPDNQPVRFFAWSLFWLIAVYPLTLLMSTIFSWIFFKMKRYKIAFGVDTLPLALSSVWLCIFIPTSIWARLSAMYWLGVWWWPTAGIAFLAISWSIWGLVAWRTRARAQSTESASSLSAI